MQTLDYSLAQAHMGFEVLPNLHWGCREDSPENKVLKMARGAT